MEEELSLDNILETDDIENLFVEEAEETLDNTNQEEKDKTNNINPTEVDPEQLFDTPESVSSEEKIQETETTPESDKDLDSSSPNYFYSSIAKALKEDGVFPDLEDSILKGIKSPEDFAEIIENQINSRLDEKSKRVNEALNIGIESSEIQRYEETIGYLDSISEDIISEETDQGEKLRQKLIYNDFVNRGYSKERAQREVKKSFDAGSDVEDAKEALSSNKEFFQASYEGLVKEAKKAQELEVKERKDAAEKLKKSILEDPKVFGDVEVDKSTRQKAFDSISKPIYKDPNTGELYTAIQKYEMDNRIDFLKNVGLLFTLTNGFKDLNKIVKSKVNKEMKKGLRELEHTLNNTARTSDGNLKFVSSVSEDPDAFIEKGWTIDIS